jgi:tRNA modification GTPase
VFSTTDTIVAVATPPGRGGIGVVRLSGPDAHGIAQRLVTHRGDFEPRHATFTRVRSRNAAQGITPAIGSDRIDHVVVTYFPRPASYTGDDVVEISAHGSPMVLRLIVAEAIEAGARLAQPGEFTLRAFLNGRIDLMQAEAVADLIDAATPLQARAAFDQLEGTLTCAIREIDAALWDLIARLEASVDFPEEGYHFVEPGAVAREIDGVLTKTQRLLDEGRRGRLVREGRHVAIVGRPNVGKSSLFNALVGSPRAIVTDVPGTTRDLVTEVVDLEGLRVTLIDTAGLRETDDVIEAEGVERTRRSATVADLVLQVVDEDEPQQIESEQLIVQSKADTRAGDCVRAGAISVSAKTGDGLTTLRRRILEALETGSGGVFRDRPEITNVRHIALVQRAHDALEGARSAASANGGALSEEFVLADLQGALAALEEITGRRATEDLLAHIFSRFCIGK